MACDLSVFLFIFFFFVVIIFLVAALRRDGRLLSGRLAKFALSPGRLASTFHRVILILRSFRSCNLFLYSGSTSGGRLES